MDSSMKKLSINSSTQNKQPVADSWEQSSDDSDNEESNKTSKRSMHVSKPSDSYPSAPPPTPMSPKFSNPPSFGGSADISTLDNPRSPRDSFSDKRPEKTTQTASRMIAAGLGVKAPKRTEEQKQYDKAVKENEAKRRNQQKEDKRRQDEERERAKAAIWDG